MITVLLLALGYVGSVAAFTAWMKATAPEGHEDDERGFIYAPVAAAPVQPVPAPAAPRRLLADGLGLAR